MINFDNARVIKGGNIILNDVSVCLEQRRIGIIGHNGSGKSTFIRLINGIELPNEGLVTVDELTTRKHRKQVLQRVGFVFQNPDNQIVYPIVREDLAFGLKNRRMLKAKISRKIEEIAKSYGVEHLLDRLTHTLSGGEKQLVALIGVLIMEPAWIILDEPTTLLDLKNKKRVMDAVHELKQSVIMVSHDLEFLKDFDRVIQFDNGRIVADGPPGDVIPRYIEHALC